jgi:hypothetical protein
MIYPVYNCLSLELNIEAKVIETKLTNFTILYEADALIPIKSAKKCELCGIF